MANTKISALTANTNPNWSEEFVYAYNNANGKITLNTVKAFIWWAGITTLNADANIWELADGTYESAYDLYYKSWEIIPTSQTTWVTKKHMLFVVSETGGGKAFFDFNVADITGTLFSYSSFGYSYSSSDWECNRLWDRTWTFKQFWPISMTYDFDALTKEGLTQIVSDAYWNCELRIATWYTVYPWVTYTLLINSVKSWDSYSVTLWNGITNPLWITLPSSSTKKCVITILTTSATAWIVTGCTVEP